MPVILQVQVFDPAHRLRVCAVADLKSVLVHLQPYQQQVLLIPIAPSGVGQFYSLGLIIGSLDPLNEECLIRSYL